MSDFESKTLTKTTQPAVAVTMDERSLPAAPLPFSGLSTRSLPWTPLSSGGSRGVRGKSGLRSNPCAHSASLHQDNGDPQEGRKTRKEPHNHRKPSTT